MSICKGVKLLEQNFENFSVIGHFSKKRKHFSQNLNVLRLQAAITTQWLQITGNSLQNDPSTGCLASIFLLLESIQFVSTLSKGRNFAVCGNKVECCFDKVERCFDIVAGVWTGPSAGVYRQTSTEVLDDEMNIGSSSTSRTGYQIVARTVSLQTDRQTMPHVSEPLRRSSWRNNTDVLFFYYHLLYTVSLEWFCLNEHVGLLRNPASLLIRFMTGPTHQRRDIGSPI